MTSKTTDKFSPEVRARAVRMVAEHPSRWAAVSSIATKIGCSAHTLNEWVKKSEGGQRQASGTAERCLGEDECFGTGEPRASSGQRDIAQSFGIFCPGGARPPTEAMISFIDEHRSRHGVEPICRLLPIAPST